MSTIWTQERLEELVRKGMLDPSALTSSTPMVSFPSQPQSHEVCKNLPSTLPRSAAMGENKTEQAARKRLQEMGFLNIERERVKIRLGPEGQRCWYTPDYSAMLHLNFCLIEVKGAFERDDARVKRMACAEWCSGVGIKFLFMQWKNKQWKLEWLA